MAVSYHRTSGPVFKAALALGFEFNKNHYFDIGVAVMQLSDREAIEEWLEKNGQKKVWHSEFKINGPSLIPPRIGWIHGIEWTIKNGDGVLFSFFTHDMKAIQEEMARQKTAKEVAKSAKDPKTPPKTMGTRTDTI